jgi:hypothetical protein
MLDLPLATLILIILSANFVDAQSTLPPPGQPVKSGAPGQFEIITQSLVSAQQVWHWYHSYELRLISHLAFPGNFEDGLLYRQGREQPNPDKRASCVGFW